MNSIKWSKNILPKTEDKYLSLVSREEAMRARSFHKSFPQYSITPLTALKNAAADMGLGGIYVKDESYRFGLNAFKVLGGSYAIGKFVAQTLKKDISETDYSYLTSADFSKNFPPCTFFTATDGNHGRGVAWSAKELGQKAVVLMPKGTVSSRFENIKKLGADVTIEDMNYDDCVRKAAELSAKTPASAVIQDTAWDGYEEIPSWIMQGYTTMVDEALEQLSALGIDRPTHVFLQAGVGSMAAAAAGYIVNRFPNNPPKIVLMECSAADCFYRSAIEGSGVAEAVGGDLASIMAGLCCGEANTIAWDILKNHVDAFLSCEDVISANGMRRLGCPVKGDAPVVSGESGAVAMGVIEALCRKNEYPELKAHLGLDETSHILFISTEGDTDPERYRKIVWEGAFHNE